MVGDHELVAAFLLLEHSQDTSSSVREVHPTVLLQSDNDCEAMVWVPSGVVDVLVDFRLKLFVHIFGATVYFPADFAPI